MKELRREANFYQLVSLLKVIDETLKEVKGPYAVIYLGGYGASAKVYTEETQGGFSTSCATLNELAKEGYQVEGVLSGSPGQVFNFSVFNFLSFFIKYIFSTTQLRGKREICDARGFLEVV